MICKGNADTGLSENKKALPVAHVIFLTSQLRISHWVVPASVFLTMIIITLKEWTVQKDKRCKTS